MTAWARLQAISCEHAARIGRIGMRQHHVPEVIKDNCEILGAGDEEAIKARVLWYITYHPEVFNACAERWKAVRA